jgi:hypothetical protein
MTVRSREVALIPNTFRVAFVHSKLDPQMTLHLRNVLSVIKNILTIAAVTLATANLTFAAECYRNGLRLYVPDGLNYPRQAWARWGISCRTPKSEIAAGSGATAAESGGRPVEWCGWWMRQHLGGHYGPEFNVARNWLNVGRPLEGPRPGAIGVKAHHVFQVVRVVDAGHVLAISGNDHNAILTRIRPTSDVIGWRDVTDERTAANKGAADQPAEDETAADKAAADKADAAIWADKLKQWEEEDSAAEAAAEKAASGKTAAGKAAVASDAVAH